MLDASPSSYVRHRGRDWNEIEVEVLGTESSSSRTSSISILRSAEPPTRELVSRSSSLTLEPYEEVDMVRTYNHITNSNAICVRPGSVEDLGARRSW